MNAMGFLFARSSKAKSPQEIVSSTSYALSRLDSISPQERKKTADDIQRLLSQIKLILLGDQENPPVPDQIALLSQEVYTTHLLEKMINHLADLDFDSKKDVANIFSTLLNRQIGSRWPTVDYLSNSPEIFDTLMKGPDNPDIALHCGIILRDCLKYEPLCKNVLSSPLFWSLFDYSQSGTFEAATDAFSTLRDVFINHRSSVLPFLIDNADRLFLRFNGLMNSTNYVTKRQSVKLLTEILLYKGNYPIMAKYVNSAENLKLIMNLLRDKSRNIQFEAFHIFKVFVVNPKKPKPVLDILLKNQDKLIKFLTKFDIERKDEVFESEKVFLIKTIANPYKLAGGNMAALQPNNRQQQQQPQPQPQAPQQRPVLSHTVSAPVVPLQNVQINLDDAKSPLESFNRSLAPNSRSDTELNQEPNVISIPELPSSYQAARTPNRTASPSISLNLVDARPKNKAAARV